MARRTTFTALIWGCPSYGQAIDSDLLLAPLLRALDAAPEVLAYEVRHQSRSPGWSLYGQGVGKDGEPQIVVTVQGDTGVVRAMMDRILSEGVGATRVNQVPALVDIREEYERDPVAERREPAQTESRRRRAIIVDAPPAAGAVGVAHPRTTDIEVMGRSAWGEYTRYRLGKIAFAEQVLRDEPETVLAVLRGLLVLGVDSNYAEGTRVYTVRGVHFDALAPGAAIPTYGVTVRRQVDDETGTAEIAEVMFDRGG